ncbi:hypothetical protein NKJ93_20530 [Mesorhizobium sp. M0028]|uniref:hypothetical protein n=1 Tax=Mesorhizobium sp. M0028 TaxID=2956849 RepID=UPI00333827AD
MLVAALETAGYGEPELHKIAKTMVRESPFDAARKCHNPEPGTQVNKNREQLK